MSMPRVLVTGAGGYLGSCLLARLAGQGRLADSQGARVVALDVRSVPDADRLPGVEYLELDVRDPRLAEIAERHQIDVIVHLAAVVTPGPDNRREEQYSIDVGGTENVLAACRAAQVRRLVVTSSGAAYGYRDDNPEWLSEEDPLRADEAFAYAWHKRLVEELLAHWRAEHSDLEQIIFRVGTILGAGVSNQITNLFDKPRLLGIRGGDDRFVFIWDQDVAACLERAIDSPVSGIFNVAGDGALSMAQLASRMGKRLIELPAPMVRAALAVAHPLGLARYGPEQVRFLQYRPVLANRRLKEVFGYVPSKTSQEVFEYFLRHRGV